jgi:hypothetical protein
MTARVLGSLCLLLSAACVLPDYEVVSSNKRPSETDAATGTSPAMLLPGAEAECGRCVQDNCREQKDSCGEHCEAFEWPVSPAWAVDDDADAYVRCLATQCEEQCDVLWGCVKQYEIPEPKSDHSVTIRVTHAVQQSTTIPGCRVTACLDLDPECKRGVGRVNEGTTDADGLAVLALPRSFEGFFLIEPPQEGDDPYLPMTAVWSEPLYRIEPVLTVSVFNRSLVPALASIVNEEVEPGKGHYIFKAQNCLPQRFVGGGAANAEADGVVVTFTSYLSSGSLVYYTRVGLTLDLDATSTSSEGLGFGGVFNVAPGAVSVFGAHRATEVSTAGFPMRGDSLGVVFLSPKTR